MNITNEKNKEEQDVFQKGGLGYQAVVSKRTSGYRTSTALTDIIDNSIDAQAKKVSIYTSGPSSQITSITIVDDGHGMSYDELHGSYEIGYTRKRKNTELGKYGMGGTLASLALASKKTTVTIGSEGLFGRYYDLELVKEHNAWGHVPFDPSEEKVDELKNFIGKKVTGTIITLEGLSIMRNRRKKDIEDQLHRAIGKAYCDAIESGLVDFTVNGKKVAAIDPLCWSHVNIKKKFPEPGKSELVFPDAPSDSPLRNLRMRIVSVMDVPQSVKGHLDKNQGIYIYRSGRLIKSSVTNCDWWSAGWNRHPNYRDCRVALYFDASLDRHFGITHLKDSVDPEQSFSDKLRDKIIPHAKLIAANRIQLEKDTTKNGRSRKAEAVTNTLNDIISNDKTNRSEIRKIALNKKETNDVPDNVIRIKNKKSVINDFKYENLEEAIGSAAPFARLKHDPENNKCNILVNTDHPFISKYHVHGNGLSQECLQIMINSVMRSKDAQSDDTKIDDFYTDFDAYLRLLAKKVD